VAVAVATFATCVVIVLVLGIPLAEQVEGLVALGGGGWCGQRAQSEQGGDAAMEGAADGACALHG